MKGHRFFACGPGATPKRNASLVEHVFFFFWAKVWSNIEAAWMQVDMIVDETTPDRELAAKISMGQEKTSLTLGNI